MSAPSSPAFRQDLQGLRAFAVLGVLLFHFGVPGTEGGYAGVDLFFVLSGFLITSILTRRTEPYLSWSDQAAFILRFLAKRLWRIAPAMTAVAMATCAAGWFILTPEDFISLGKEAFAAITFWPNLYFNAEADYFATASAYRPLLHTWSLGVEMQFYLLWPLVLTAIRLLPGRRQSYAVLLLLALSFIACQILTFADPSVAFYNPGPRLWEFLIGALAAWHVMPPRTELAAGSKWQQAGDWIALLTLLATPALFGPATLWPAPSALLPCLAAGWLISRPVKTRLVQSLLENRLAGVIGTLSYSLYLVHWPLVVFSNTLFFPEPSFTLRMALLAACIPLSALLYVLIERPMRTLGAAPGLPPLKLGGVAAWGGAITLCLLLASSNGLPGRWKTGDLVALTKAERNPEVSDPVCGGTGTSLLCEKGAAGGIALWGDSHAAALEETMKSWAEETGTHFRAFIGYGCPPLPGAYLRNTPVSLPKSKCLRNGTPVLEAILADDKIGTVILSARWVWYFTGTRNGPDRGGPVYLTEDKWTLASKTGNRAVFEASLKELAKALQAAGKKIILLQPVPEFTFDPVRCYQAELLGREAHGTCRMEKAEAEKRQDETNRFFASLAAENSAVHLIQPDPVFCRDTTCSPVLDGRMAYQDDDHVNRIGAAALLPLLIQAAE
ncbi:acyltransferase family protein [Roseibium litorale]|uniref:Acyltransferase n=1 Tax=Roseibium litorale TaxID=2803841 RepID=A0ABR9CIE9_9HYPH|nr:acyltransferase family protein [Roseibium litorale]MBD8890503.1 acyltransferase [Roseibium litorale]